MYGVVAPFSSPIVWPARSPACASPLRGGRHRERRPRAHLGVRSGRRLSELGAQAGQFFMWRFLTREGWWQAHPFSLSAAPNGRWLRLTVKALGDHSAGGPAAAGYPGPGRGRPTARSRTGRRRQRKVLFIGAGVGVTPLRAMFESTAAVPGGSAFIYRAGAPGDLALRAELDDICRPPAGPRALPGRVEARSPRVPGPRPHPEPGARRRPKRRVRVRPAGLHQRWSRLRCGPWGSPGPRSTPNRSSSRRARTDMRRAVIATAGTVVGLVALLGYKSSGAVNVQRVSVGRRPVRAPRHYRPAPRPPPPRPRRRPDHGSARRPRPPMAAGPTTTGPATRTYDGQLVTYLYGNIEVAVQPWTGTGS